MQQRRRTALEEQLATAATPGQCAETAGQELAEDADKAAKLRAKAERRAQQVPQHLAEVAAKETRLDALLGQLATRGADLALVRSEMEAMGLQERLKTFDLNKAAHDQRGRPDGFTGLVLESPRACPSWSVPARLRILSFGASGAARTCGSRLRRARARACYCGRRWRAT